MTFTYNESAVIKICGYNFANSYDVRFLFNKSVFPKRLKLHGYTFKFAIFGEAGDGKGVRGVDNNPHFHALIFLYPSSDCDRYFHDTTNFLTLCHNAWNQDNFSTCRKYKHLHRGNVSYSSKGALVEDDKVFSYCSMYCVKELSDNVYNNRVSYLFDRVAFMTLSRFAFVVPDDSPCAKYIYPYDSQQSVVKSFFQSYGNKISMLAPYKVKSDDYVCILHDAVVDLYNEVFGVTDIDLFNSWLFRTDYVFSTPLYRDLMDTELFSRFRDFIVRRHQLRYRLSPNLGINGLNYIDSNFMLDVSQFKSFSTPKINLPSYYYRKYLFDVVKHDDHYLYVRNKKFPAYFMKHLTISKFENALQSYRVNRASFVEYLDESMREFLADIPDSVFVAFKPFRGLCFNSCDTPILDMSYPWQYFSSLNFTKHEFYSIPYSQKFFFDTQGFVDFSLHPQFAYPRITELSFLYDKFLSQSKSIQRLTDVKDYFVLNNISNTPIYEVFQPIQSYQQTS